MTTTTDQDAEFHEITPEQQQIILASLPKCAECGGDIEKVRFVAYQLHKFHVEVDGSNGDILAYSAYYDTVDVEVEGKVVLPSPSSTASDYIVHPTVECARGHFWNEPRLKLTKQHSDGEDWQVLP